MVIKKSVFLALIFSLVLISFGLLSSAARDPRKQLEDCQRRCEWETRGGREEQQQCRQECRERYEEDNPHRQGKRHSWSEEEEEEEEQQSEEQIPFFFPSSSDKFRKTRFSEEEGSFQVLERFAEKSGQLKYLNDFRLASWEINPNTFVLPHHCDAESIFLVANGKGTVTFLTDEHKEATNVERGTVVRVPAGTTVYMVNRDNKQRLEIIVLAMPINTPGRFQSFIPIGNPEEYPPSYFEVFSPEILEAALNTPREQLEKLSQRQQQEQGQQGIFRKARPEQIRALSREASSPSKGKQERFSFNLLSQSPKFSNQHGLFFEATPWDFNALNLTLVSVAACKLKQGSIFVPHYNSLATFVVVVAEGSGRIQMAAPHRAQQEQGERESQEEERQSQRQRQRGSRQEEEEESESEERSLGYMRVEAQVSAGDVFIVPAGYPVTYVASKNENLKMFAFGLNSLNNDRIFLAGKKNLFKQMDSEAKELSFGVPSRLVDEIFENNPEESYFVPPFSQQQQQQQREQGRRSRGSGRGSPLSSILDFGRIF